jgi:hypothetical protein
MPCDQISLFNFESMRTSGVRIIFSANFFNSFTARGARFLNALGETTTSTIDRQRTDNLHAVQAFVQIHRVFTSDDFVGDLFLAAAAAAFAFFSFGIGH